MSYFKLGLQTYSFYSEKIDITYSFFKKNVVHLQKIKQ